MSRKGLYEIVIPTDRWSVRAVSPIDIRDDKIRDTDRLPVIVSPGWAKSPERHRGLLEDLANAGFLPIGVDSRYAYADRQLHPTSRRFTKLVKQNYAVGDTNPYFHLDTSTQNRWQLRRPTSLLYLCDRLQLGSRMHIGHSEGGRIATLAASASIAETRGLVIVNGAGTGDSSGGLKRLVHSNVNRISDFSRGEADLKDATSSALGSFTYAATHLRRTLKEKEIIQSANIWPVIGSIASMNKPVAVFHAVDDELISYEDSQIRSGHYPEVSFYGIEGNHSNIYKSEVRKLVITELLRQAQISS